MYFRAVIMTLETVQASNANDQTWIFEDFNVPSPMEVNLRKFARRRIDIATKKADISFFERDLETCV